MHLSVVCICWIAPTLEQLVTTVEKPTNVLTYLRFLATDLRRILHPPHLLFHILSSIQTCSLLISMNSTLFIHHHLLINPPAQHWAHQYHPTDLESSTSLSVSLIHCSEVPGLPLLDGCWTLLTLVFLFLLPILTPAHSPHSSQSSILKIVLSLCSPCMRIKPQLLTLAHKPYMMQPLLHFGSYPRLSPCPPLCANNTKACQ